MKEICPICETGELETRLENIDVILQSGSRATLPNVRVDFCPVCNDYMVDAYELKKHKDQYDFSRLIKPE